MDNVHEFPDPRVIDQEAAAWLARLDADAPLSKVEKADLKNWLGRSQRHRESLESLNQFWGNNVLTELMVPPSREGQASSLLSYVVQKFVGWPVAGIAVAACCVLALVFALPSGSSFSETNGLYVTAVGQQKTVTLQDGSVVHLNTDSQLDVNFDEGFRNLRLLRGEAYFEVAKNPERPFRVYAGAGRVQAVGTAFNVHIEDAGLNVLVTEGRVALASLGEAAFSQPEIDGSEVDPFVQSNSRELGILDAGELVELRIAENPRSGAIGLEANIETVEEAELSRVESWREGYMFFSGEPLDEVVEEISRYTTLSIVITDPELKQLQIGGRFKAGDTDSMFAALETNFGIEVKQLNYNKVELDLARN